MKELYLLSNREGKEVEASRSSAKDIKAVLCHEFNIVTLELGGRSWVSQLNEIKKKGLYFLTTHGGFGENGSLQSYLEASRKTYTFSQSATCGILANKHFTKLVYKSLEIKTPDWCFDKKLFGSHGLSGEGFVEKPIQGGSKFGINRIFGETALSKKNGYNRKIYSWI